MESRRHLYSMPSRPMHAPLQRACMGLESTGETAKFPDMRGVQQTELTLNHGLVPGSWLDCERPVLDVCLDAGVLELASDQPLGVEHCVYGVHGHLQQNTIA